MGGGPGICQGSARYSLPCAAGEGWGGGARRWLCRPAGSVCRLHAHQSIRLHAGFFHQRRIAGDFRFDEGGEFVRCRWCCLGALFGQPRFELRVVQHLDEFGVEFRGDRCSCVGRQESAKPRDGFKARVAALGHGRQRRHQWRAFQTRHGDRAQPSGFHQRQRRGQAADQQLRFTADHCG